METAFKTGQSKGLTVRTEKGNVLTLVPVREDIIRCVYAKEACGMEHSVILEDKEYGSVWYRTWEGEEGPVLETERLRVSVDPASEALCFEDKKRGKLLLKEGKKELGKIDVMRYTTEGEEPVIRRVKTVDGERNFIMNLKEVKDHEAYRGKYGFCFKEDEGIYGLGQGEEGIYNYRHHCQYLYQHNMRIPMPTLYSDEGYGLLFDCGSLMTFVDDGEDSYLFMDTVEKLDYYFVAGERPDEVIDGFRYLTGRAVLLPRWAFGYIQSKEQYYTAKELSDVVERYRSLQVPIDCVVQDWNTWEEGNWGEKLPDEKRYGDLREQTERLAGMHAHAMVSVWPNMNTGGKNHTEFLRAGYLLNDLSTYDAFNREARAMYWKQAKEKLFNGGFEAWWCDSTEPFSGPDWNGEVKREAWERFALVGNEHKKYLEPEKANLYALLHALGIYENQRKDREDIRVLNLTRSGYASGQKYGAVLWSGDTCASYETLKKQIVEGLNMGLSGYPYWTLDIGGFFTVGSKWQNRGCGCHQDPSPKWFWQGEYDEGVKDDGYKELYVRWLQLGTFLPMFRSHGTDTPREIWNFGKKGDRFYDAIETFIRLRYRVMPYIYSLAASVVFENATIMRSLLFDFVHDRQAVRIKDQFLFGKSLLVCPVTEPMYYEAGNRKLEGKEKKRRCYLPEGTGWHDFFTGARHRGGQWIDAQAEIDRIPLFVREGSILPMKEGLQYADDGKEAPLFLHIYTGADASFTLYEDEGNGYGYEKGECERIGIRWEDRTRTLSLQERKGSYPGMPRNVEIRPVTDGQPGEPFIYTGEAVTVSLPRNRKLPGNVRIP